MLGRHPISGTITTSLAGLIGGIAATVAVTPELREAGGTDVIFEPPDLGPFGRGLLLAISVVAAGVILWALSGNRIGGPPRRTIEVTAVSVAVGVLAGLGYRIVTAKSVGANIGGGLVLLASPFAALLFFGYVAERLLECAHRATPASDTVSICRLRWRSAWPRSGGTNKARLRRVRPRYRIGNLLDSPLDQRAERAPHNPRPRTTPRRRHQTFNV